MSQAPQPSPTPKPASARDDAVAVINAYGAFRVLLVLMAIWSFFEGFALFFGRGGALTLGGSGEEKRVAEQIIGAHLLILVPVYGLLAWRRDRYRALMWIPYAAQLAMVLPLGISLLRLQNVGVLLFVVSAVFLTLLVYFWWQSHPLEFFQKNDELAPAPPDDAQAILDEEEDDGTTTTNSPDAATRRRYRRQ
ncbi:MAG: hypothetical protein EPO22_10435 [Dehalococcoidia bacterium]|nr:MAG: hypothetical protein EPO22_10435 [Dehalococcoidia bacterium]